MKRSLSNLITIITFSWFAVISIIFLSCGDDEPNLINKQTGETQKALAVKYCSKCHLHVDPQLLDSITWADQVLPKMAPKLGIGVWRDNQYYPINADTKNVSITMTDWEKIVEYYTSEAPASLKEPPRMDSVTYGWGPFAMLVPQVEKNHPSTTTMVSFDSINHTIYSSDQTNKLFKMDASLRLLSEQTLTSPAVSLNYVRDGGGLYGIITSIGSLFPSDFNNGEVGKFAINNHNDDTVSYMVKNLYRPVATAHLDVNKDNKYDYFIAEFGNNKGRFSMATEDQDGIFTVHSVFDMPGAIQIEKTDYNNDGEVDFLVLFAQADEGIWLFLNDGRGSFEKKNLLRFSPVNGSTSFQYADFNNDGFKDFLYTCGDNGDFSRILKPYHGIYIYLNDGRDHFVETRFLPVNGCTKAIARDFDKDGDLDISAIAFFPDMSGQLPQSFIYYQHNETLQFQTFILPIQKSGRWLCMDVKDFDGDGDSDIVLGNFSQGFINQKGITPDWNTTLPFLVLQNKVSNTRRPE